MHKQQLLLTRVRSKINIDSIDRNTIFSFMTQNLEPRLVAYKLDYIFPPVTEPLWN